MIAGLVLTLGLFQRGFLEVRPLIMCGVGFLLYFVMVRVLLDIREYLLEIKQGPGSRALARDVVRLQDLKKLRGWIYIAMILFCAILMGASNTLAAEFYLMASLFLVLASKNYFIRGFLKERPYFQAVLDQGVMVLVLYFGMSVLQPEITGQVETLFLIVIFSGILLQRQMSRKPLPFASSWIVYTKLVLVSLLVVYSAYRIQWLKPVLIAQIIFAATLAYFNFDLKRWGWVERIMSVIFLATSWIMPTLAWIDYR